MKSCDHQIWNLIEKCFIMMPISSHLSNLPNQVICGVMWLLHWIPHQPKYFCPLYKHIYRYIPPYLASQLPAPGYCCEHHDVPCESTQVTSWCYYKDASTCFTFSHDSLLEMFRYICESRLTSAQIAMTYRPLARAQLSSVKQILQPISSTCGIAKFPCTGSVGSNEI